jgi:hypothetical protein
LATRSAVPEETNHTSRTRLLGSNAFRTLLLPADAELRKVHRQQQRLLVTIDLGETTSHIKYGLPPLAWPEKEDIFEAVHLLERPKDRLLEELFWFHEIESLSDLPRQQVQEALRSTAADTTTGGIIDLHNLAVFHSILGLEEDPSQWKPALDLWTGLFDQDRFWAFLQIRAQKINCPHWDREFLKAAACRRLSATLCAQITLEIKRRDAAAVAALVRVTREHQYWLDLSPALQLVEQQHIRTGYVSLGAIHDRLAGISRGGSHAAIRTSLAESEEELSTVANNYGSVVRDLGQPAGTSAWDDAVASLYQEMAKACASLLEDADAAQRLLTRARELACDAHLRDSLERDQQAVQKEKARRVHAHRLRESADREASLRQQQDLERASLCREAEQLASFGDFAGAQSKLADALPLSNGQQRLEVQAAMTRFAWAKVLWGIDTSRKHPVLSTRKFIGMTFLGKQNYDRPTQSYLTVHWLTIFFLPVFPLGAYRVSDAGPSSYSVYGKTPLPLLLKIARGAIPAGGLACAFFGALWANSAGTALSRAISALNTSESPVIVKSSGSDALHRKIRKVPVTPTNSPAVPDSELAALAAQRQKLDREAVDLQKRKTYLDSVSDSYAGKRVPADGWVTYEGVLAEYRSSLQKHAADLSAFKKDCTAHLLRVENDHSPITTRNDSSEQTQETAYSPNETKPAATSPCYQ